MTETPLSSLGFHLLTPERGAEFFDVDRYNATIYVRDLFRQGITVLYDTKDGQTRVWDNHGKHWMIWTVMTLDELENLLDESVDPIIERITNL